MFRSDDLDFDLPAVIVPKTPRPIREHRLYVLREDGQAEHTRVDDLGEVLKAGDLIVFNDSKVMPVQFYLDENRFILFIQHEQDNLQSVIVICPFKPRVGESFTLSFGELTLLDHEPGWDVYSAKIDPIDPALNLPRIVAEYGQFPLPIYIQRIPKQEDETALQSVFARENGSIAPPVASSHFDAYSLERIRSSRVEIATVTLHIGYGTFRSFKTEYVDEHRMDEEFFSISATTIQKIEETRRRGGRVVAIGTTVVRVLESLGEDWDMHVTNNIDVSGHTNIFIKPPYRPKIVGGLLTNFQYPRLPVICMAATFVGLDKLRMLYEDAVSLDYNFFSLGDAMLLMFPAKSC